MSDIIYTDGGSTGAQYRLRINGANLELLRDNVLVASQPLASVNAVTIDGGSGGDTLLVDELISLPGGVTFNGGLPLGPPGDGIVVSNNALTSASVTYTNATDGTMVFTSGATTATYIFTGIDPIDMTGSTVADLVFNLPGGTDTQLEDDGTAANNESQLRDVGGGFELTPFAHPTNSLTVNGTATDNVTVNLSDDLGTIGLVINANTTTFTTLGSTTTLAAVTTDATGTTAINNGGITTTGAQSYNDAVTLGAITTLASTGAGGLTLASTVNGAFVLIADTAGTTTFGGAVGGTTALTSVTTDAGGTTALNGGSVTTTGVQSYNDAVTLGSNTALTTTGAGNLSFADVLNGAFDLIANTAGTTTFGGVVGGGTALASVTTDAAGTTAINGGPVTTTGAQTYNDTVTLGAATELTSTGGGTITLASTVNQVFDLAVNTAGAGLLSDVISGAGGFTQNGTGTTTLAAANLYIGATTVNAGTLLVNGSIAQSTTAVNGGTLGGTGTTGAVNVASGGTLSPGASAGILTTGAVTFTSGATFRVELNGATAGSGYDQLNVLGAVLLANATLNASSGFFSPAVGDSFTIINNDGADAVGGTFAGLAEGDTTLIGGRAYRITYVGGTGNDVVLSLGALTISGTDPVNVLADVDASTVSATNTTTNTTSIARVQEFADDITATVNAGVTVNGWGLALTTMKTDGSITVVNDGSVVVDDAAADGQAALLLTGNGAGPISYAGTGSISNDATNTPSSVGLRVVSGSGSGSNLVQVAGAITGLIGIEAIGGTTNVVVSGAITGTGGTAISFDNTSLANTVDLKTTAVITGNLVGSGNDTVRLSGTAGTGSFDLSKIGSGFTQLVKTEASSWTMTGTFADAGATTTVINGSLFVDGSIGGDVIVGAAFSEPLPVPPALLGGTGTVADLLMQSGGILAPGVGAGTLTVTGNLTMALSSTLRIEIGGTGAGQYDVLHVSGTAPDTGAVNLGAATLTGALINGFTPTLGQTFTIIQNDGADAIGDLFTGLSEGSGVSLGGQTFTVSYVGGDGNDVVLTAAANGPPGLTGFGPTAEVEQAGPAALPQILDGIVTFTDVEGNFNGGTLTVSGLLAEDTVSVLQTGFDPGAFLIEENGAVDRLLFEGVEIGGISGGVGANLDITFNGSATTAAIDALIQNLTLLDLSATPTFERTLFLTVTDSDGASTGTQPLLVQVFNGDIENGTPGNDSFAPPGSAHIDADGGIDTVTFNFRLVDATVTYVDNTVVIDTASTHSVLIGVERYVFTDGTVDNNDGNWLVDDLFYYSKYHDVWNAHADADQHYAANGWHEGRNPDAFFSTSVYLSANPDVAAGGVNPLAHYAQFGWKEGRLPSINFDPAQYLAANPDVDAANVDPLGHFLQFGAGEGRLPFAATVLATANGFDYVFYLNNNPDVAAAGVDPFQHFMTVGWTEGRNPNAFFDTNGYLANYADVDAANVNPLTHYDAFGWHEGRDPSTGFDTTSYLAAYPDVQAAGVNPLTHFLHFGIDEGRSAFADGVWG